MAGRSATTDKSGKTGASAKGKVGWLGCKTARTHAHTHTQTHGWRLQAVCSLLTQSPTDDALKVNEYCRTAGACFVDTIINPPGFSKKERGREEEGEGESEIERWRGRKGEIKQSERNRARVSERASGTCERWGGAAEGESGRERERKQERDRGILRESKRERGLQ